MLLEWGNQHHNPVCLPGRVFFPHGSGHLKRGSPLPGSRAIEVSRGNVDGMRHTQVSAALWSFLPPAPAAAELHPNCTRVCVVEALWLPWRKQGCPDGCGFCLATKPHHSPATCKPLPSRGRCQQGWFPPRSACGLTPRGKPASAAAWLLALVVGLASITNHLLHIRKQKPGIRAV